MDEKKFFAGIYLLAHLLNNKTAEQNESPYEYEVAKEAYLWADAFSTKESVLDITNDQNLTGETQKDEKMSEKMSDLHDKFESESDIACAILVLAESIDRMTHDLGTAGGTAPGGGSMGAIELMAKEIKEGSERLSEAIDEIGKTMVDVHGVKQ